MSVTYLKSIVETATPVLCYYTNTRDRVQVIRLDDGSDRNWQRVVFPRERLMFDALATAVLEVYEGGEDGDRLFERLDCRELACTGME